MSLSVDTKWVGEKKKIGKLVGFLSPHPDSKSFLGPRRVHWSQPEDNYKFSVTPYGTFNVSFISSVFTGTLVYPLEHKSFLYDTLLCHTDLDLCRPNLGTEVTNDRHVKTYIIHWNDFETKEERFSPRLLWPRNSYDGKCVIIVVTLIKCTCIFIRRNMLFYLCYYIIYVGVFLQCT